MEETKGLDGIIAAKSAITYIDDEMIRYRGYRVDDLVHNAEFEEIIYLLWYGELPNIDEYMEFKKELKKDSNLSDNIITVMKLLPKNADFIDVMRVIISISALYNTEVKDFSHAANLKKATFLMAQIAPIVATLFRVRNNLEPVKANPKLSYAANFLYMLTGEKPDELAERAFDQALILHADHEFNASTFSARVTVSTLSDMHSGVISAMGALKGSLHGGANEQVMMMLEEIGDRSRIKEYIDNKLAQGEKIMGIGHKVYKHGDPRTIHLKEITRQIADLKGDMSYFNLSCEIADYVYEQKKLLPNVDFYSATLYNYLGISKDLFTPIFIISRMSGWTAHIMEQYENNRLIRPRAKYSGPEDRKYIPISNR
jgi:citrate synthase